MGLVLYVLLLVALALHFSPAFDAQTGRFALALGVIGLWRYGWAAVHLVRAILYLRVDFPRLRRLTETATDAPEVFVVVTSFQEDAAVTSRVFTALFQEAAAQPAPATVVAAVGDAAEQRLIEELAGRLAPGLRVVTLLQDGSGKRSALAEALRAVARRQPAAGAVVVLMDGDTLLPPGCLRRSLPFLSAMPRVGGLTVDAFPAVAGSAWARDWYAVRYAMRHLQMCSMSLSRRLLVLTGRFCALRADIVTRPDFISTVETDSLEHWRYGRFRFLTGDDKSTWFWLLRHGWDMLYVPDVAITSAESLPSGRFLARSAALMTRWFGNMLRGGGRAIALGPRRTGGFLWWCLVDQRLSMWTSLTGPAASLLWALFVSADALIAYVIWVMASRLAQASVLAATRRGLSFRWPLLLYYTQVAGALVKIHVAFRLNRQRWTRQNLPDAPAPAVQAGWDAYISGLAYAAFALTVAVTAGAVALPDRIAVHAAATAMLAASPDSRAGPSSDAAADIQARLDRAAPGDVVRLGEGVYHLHRPVRLRRDRVTLAGAGAGRTMLVAAFPGRDVGIVTIEGEGPTDRCSSLAAPVSAAADRIALAADLALRRGDYLDLSAANHPAFLDRLGAERWRRSSPRLRRTLAEVQAVEGRAATLAAPVGVDLPRGSRVCVTRLVEAAVTDLTIAYDLGGRPSPTAYRNIRPRHAVDGLLVRQAAKTTIANVVIVDAGRHPLHFDTVLAPRVTAVRLEGAWNKGAGGNGYLRIARTVRGRLDDIAVRGLRHVAFQWSSHHNSLRGLDSDTDVNFHGGFSHHNTVAAVFLSPRGGHPWPAVVRTPSDARWAPPDGPENRVIMMEGQG